MGAFQYQILRDEANNNAALVEEVKQGKHYCGALWGAFTGLFGPSSNELLVVSALDEAADPVSTPKPSPKAIAGEYWQSTARPVGTAPCTRDGLYVFRRFMVREEHVDEVVALSTQAWETFETSAEYAAEPQGLFVPGADAEGQVRMMLVTWYDGFSSWETSRQPARQARENFQRRHALTQSTYAIATRLVHS